MGVILLLSLAATVVAQSTSATSNSTYWYANVKHNGINPGLPGGVNWTVFRNVLDYGAIGDGYTDDTAAIQSAITTGDANGPRGSGVFGSTGQPAVVFFPPGTYLTSAPIQNYIGTVLMGDPTNRPIIQANTNFTGANLISGADPNSNTTGIVGFYHEIKNLVFNSTLLPRSTSITLVSWSVSQGCQLSNCVFAMPQGAASHIAIQSSGSNSPLLLNNLEIRGGGVGWTGSSTQYHFKNIYFKGVITGIQPINTVQISVQGGRFEDVNTGIDMSGGSLGQLNLFDSSASNTSVLVYTDANQTSSQGSIVVENVIVDSKVPVTIQAGNTTLLTGSITTGHTWIRGHVYSGTSANVTASASNSTGKMIASSRPAALLNGTGSYITITPPTYSEFLLHQIVNVKDVAGHPVAGNGYTDDTASIQAILYAASDAGEVLYFPHGIYNITNTLYIPCGIRIWGESFSELRASGINFKDPKNRRPMIQVGTSSAVGIAQFTDMLFTVAEPLPGAVLVEVNMAGIKPGDVAFFNSHFRVGGSRNTTTNSCDVISNCTAVHVAAHISKSSSSYWENTWVWSADHNIDGDVFGAYPSPAGGVLIEATKGTWMLGLGVEHFSLYQVTITSASNVFIGLQQGEAAEYQGAGNTLLPPNPWTPYLLGTDPKFTWCPANATLSTSSSSSASSTTPSSSTSSASSDSGTSSASSSSGTVRFQGRSQVNLPISQHHRNPRQAATISSSSSSSSSSISSTSRSSTTSSPSSSPTPVNPYNYDTCQMSIYQRVISSSNINLYSSGFWTYVSGPNATICTADCQDNAVIYEGNRKLFAYGISTINNEYLVVESGPGGNKYVPAVPHLGNDAGMEGVFDTAGVAAYLRQST